MDATLTVSAVEATTATLTIGNYGGAWYHKYTAPTGGTCSSVVAAGTTTADLTGLSGNTSYTYKAYSNSGCTTELATAGAFLTKPGQPTGVTVTRTGSGELTIAASVSGAGAIGKWQMQQKSGGSFGDWTDIATSNATSLTHAVGSLTNGTSYQFKVRACNNSQGDCNGVASAATTAIAPTAATLAASNVQSTTATLAIGIHTGNWYHKYTTPTGGTCSSSAVTGTSTNLTGLAPDTSYTFKAYSDSGCTTELTNDTSDAEFTTKIGPLTSLQVEPRHQSLRVSWTTRGRINGIGGIVRIQYKSGNQNWTTTDFSWPVQKAVTIGSLTNGVTYSVRGRQITSPSNRGPWTVVTATPATQPPDKPSAPTLTDGSNDGELNVTWTAPASDGAAITGYGVQYRKTSADTWTDFTHSGTGTTASLTGLTGGTRYQVRVQATNSVGNSAWSDAATRLAPITTAVKPPAPSKPVTTAGNASVTLTWRSGGDGGSAITSWEYSQAVKPSGGTFGEFGSWTSISNSGASTTSTTISSLTNGSTYKFKIRAVNSVGNGAASDASNEVTPAVATLAADNITTTGVTLTLGIHTAAWAYKQTAPTVGTCTTVAANVKTATVTGLASNTGYTFKAYSDSNCSNELALAPTFLTIPAKPGTPTATATGNGTLTIAATVTGSGGLSKWQIQRAERASGSNSFGSFGDWSDVSSTSTTLSHAVTGLTVGSSYRFKVRAVNSRGNGTASQATGFVPDAPARPTLSAANGSLTVTWSAPGNGGPALSGYMLRYFNRANARDVGTSVDISGGATSRTDTSATLTLSGHTTAWYYKRTAGTPADSTCNAVTAGTTTASLTGLAGNTSYTYKAYSTNRSCSAANLLATATSFLTKPAKAATPTVTTNVGSGTLRLTSSVTGGSGALSKWQYQQAEKPSGSSTFGSYGTWTNITATTVSLSHTVTGLTNGTEYKFKVRAVNTTGTGATSDASTAPGLAAEDGSVTHDAAKLTVSNWSAAWYHKRTAPTGNNTCTSVTAGTTTAPLTSLAGNTAYTYKAYSDASCNTEITANATDAEFLTKPAKPTTPTVVGAGSQKLKITASVGGDGTISKWQVQQAEKPPGNSNFGNFGNWNDITATSTDLSHTVTGLTNGTDYKFKVRACNNSQGTCNGLTSDASTAVAPLDKTLTASNVEATTATLTVGNHANAWYYKYTAPATPEGTCSAEIAANTTTAAVTGLSGNTSYTFKAYSDNTCTTELATADAFLTKPGKAATPTTAAGTNSGELDLSASVGGAGTLVRWQYIKKEGSDNFNEDEDSWSDIASTANPLSGHTLTGLKAGVSYQFKVRAVNATGTGTASDASAAAKPTPATLTASAVEATTATLTIGKHSGAWYYKRTAGTPADNTCHAVTTANTTTADLTGLATNTNYTYKTYSDSTCTTELTDVTSDAEFLTKPGTPTKPVATARVGTDRLRLSATVSGDGAITGWEVQRAEKPSGNTTFGEFGDWTAIAATSRSLNHIVTGLTAGTAYQFKVRACNNNQGDCNGTGAESEASDETTPSAASRPTPPAPVPDETLTVSTVEATTATLTIGNHSGSWYYTYTTPSGGTCSTNAVSGTTTTLTGLAGNTSYTFKAYSNSSCTSELAVTDPFLTKPGKPTKPGDSTSPPVATVAETAGHLTLKASVTGDGAITGWQLQRAEKPAGNSAFGEFSDWSDIASTSQSLSYTITGLTENTSYQFKVRAVNATGTGEASDASTAVAPSAATPTPDETLTVSAIETTTVTLTIANYSGSWYYKATAPSSGSCSADAVSGTSTTLTNLSGNTSYTFKAYTDSGCTDANELAVTSAFLTKPGQPTKPTVAAGAGSGQLTLSASVTGDGAISKWQVQQKASTASTYGAWQDVPSSSANTLTQTVTDITSATTTTLTHTVTGLTNGTSYQFKVRAVNATGEGEESDASTALAPAQANLAVVKQANATTATLTLTWDGSGEWSYDYREQEAAAESAELDATAAVGASSGSTCTNVSAGRRIVTVEGLDANASYVFTAYSGSGCSTNSQSDVLLASTTAADPSVNPGNRLPKFPPDADASAVATEGEAFTYTVKAATDHDGDILTYDAVLVGSSIDGSSGDGSSGGLPGSGDLLPLPDWLTFDGNASEGPTFSSKDPAFNGTPGEPATFRIRVRASDGKGVTDSLAFLTFTLTVKEKNDPPTSMETPDNTRLPQVAKQWLARLGRTVSAQVTQSITGRLSDDTNAGRITVNGQTVSLSGGEVSRAADGEGEADDTSGDLTGLNGADPFATAAPNTKEVVDEEPVKATATTRDLLLGSSFRLPLNPGSADNRPSDGAKAAVGERAGSGQGLNSALGATLEATAASDADGSGGASGSVVSATTASGGGGWMVWGEAALTNFDSTVEDVRVDGEVLTGVAALDWEQDRWLLGLALSQSRGDGSFSAPQTDRDDAIKGTLKSSLTALHPYVRYRPSAGLEFWGVAGYGRGSMTLDADDEAAANPEIWLSTIGIGGRAALLTPEQTGGLELDLTADVLHTRTGAAADIPLRDAVEASTTRVRLGVESTWPWQNADGTSVVPSLPTALRYDAGDAETGLGVEVGAGWTYANPNRGLTLSADIRGLLSRQAADGGLGLREWGGSGSARYDRGGDGLGLTASLSPSWGVSGSAKDQLWSEVAPPFPTAKGDGTADASGGSGGNAANNDAMRLEGEIGYGFAAFNGNAVITPYAGLSLSDGSPDWRFGGRLSFSPGLAISIEGTRKEQQNAAPDHSVQLDINTTW